MVHRKLAWQALWIAARAYDRGRTAEVPVAELEAFARDCWPEVRSLSSYRSLRLRRRIGPKFMPYLQPLILTAVARRAQGTVVVAVMAAPRNMNRCDWHSDEGVDEK